MSSVLIGYHYTRGFITRASGRFPLNYENSPVYNFFAYIFLYSLSASVLETKVSENNIYGRTYFK